MEFHAVNLRPDDPHYYQNPDAPTSYDEGFGESQHAPGRSIGYPSGNIFQHSSNRSSKCSSFSPYEITYRGTNSQVDHLTRTVVLTLS
jgi:hypothetical protein